MRTRSLPLGDKNIAGRRASARRKELSIMQTELQTWLYKYKYTGALAARRAEEAGE